MPWPAERHHPAGHRNLRAGRSHLRAVVGCEAVSEELPLVVDGTRRPSAAMADHLRGCPRCRTEMSSYERLLATLRSLRDETLDLPAGVLAAGPYIVERLAAERSGSAGGAGRSGVNGRPGFTGLSGFLRPSGAVGRFGALGHRPTPGWALAGALGVAAVGACAVLVARRGGTMALGT